MAIDFNRQIQVTIMTYFLYFEYLWLYDDWHVEQFCELLVPSLGTDTQYLSVLVVSVCLLFSSCCACVGMCMKGGQCHWNLIFFSQRSALNNQSNVSDVLFIQCSKKCSISCMMHFFLYRSQRFRPTAQ